MENFITVVNGCHLNLTKNKTTNANELKVYTRPYSKF